MILSFRGEIGSGKSTASDFFVKQFGFVRVSFAEPLKVEAFDALWQGSEALGLFAYELNDPQVSYRITNFCPHFEFPARDLYYIQPDEKVAFINKHKAVLGPLLQWWGTEYRRGRFSETYWIDQFASQVYKLRAGGYRVVTDDCRFDNEIDFVNQLGGKHIFIVRPKAAEQASEVRGGETRNMAHASEKNNDPFDKRHYTVLGNFGSLRDFQTLLYGVGHGLLTFEYGYDDRALRSQS